MAATGLGTPAALLRQAMALHRAGREDEADHHYALVLDADPRHAQALRLRGILARDTGRLDLSVALLQKAAEAAPGDPEPVAELGLSHLACGRLQLAEAAFRDALDRDPASLKALANLGAVLQHQGHAVPALAAYREALALAPHDPEVRCNLAQTLLEGGHGDEALRECDEALSMAPRHATVLATRGAILCSLERHAEALPVLEAAVDSSRASPRHEPPPGEAVDLPLINLALAFRELGRNGQAIATLEAAVRANPDNARAVADLALSWSGDGHCGMALDITAEFLDRHPGERLILAARTVALREAGREAEARALIDLDGLVAIRDLPATGDEVARLNEALAALIRADPSLMPSPASKSTRGGTQTGEFNPLRQPLIREFQAWVNAELRGIIAAFREAGFAGHPAMDWASESWTLRMWGNVLASGGHQLPHIHPLGWLSGVYYVQVPTAITGTDDGALEFGSLPRWIRHRQAPPTRVIAPVAGRLVVFPSFFHHRTLPFDAGDGQRISIAFDVMPARTGWPSQRG